MLRLRRRAASEHGSASPATEKRESLWRSYGTWLRPVARVGRAVRHAVSSLGWLTFGTAAALLIAAAVAGWVEARYAACFLLLVLLAGALMTIGRTRIDVSLEVNPQRLTVGTPAAARLGVRNVARGLMLPLWLRIPVGRETAAFVLPPLRPQHEHEEIMIIPTARRGVIVVGPVVTQRGDPFGLVRRELTWGDPVEVFVHPTIVALETFGAGLLRDLEGQTTNDISMSDLAFHTLREYSPGDDRRYIHWRSSAKASAVRGEATFLVRQFLDTRRSHLAVVLDTDPGSYADADEFELAVSAAASMTIRAVRDETPVTVVAGRYAEIDPPAHRALDVFARAEMEPGPTLHDSALRAARMSADISVVVLVTGSAAPSDMLLRASAQLPYEVTRLGVRCVLGARPALGQAGDLRVLTLGALSQLPAVLRGATVA